MSRLFIPIGAVAMSLFCTRLADVDSSKDDVHNLVNLLPGKDIVIEKVHDYLQEQEKRLGTLRKHIEDYSKEYGRAIQNVAQTLNDATRKSSTNDDKEIKEEVHESVINNPHDFVQYANTTFGRLCNEEILLTADIQKKLKCRYVDHGIPFLKIAPFKEEEAALDPRIVLYHDVIYEEEIEALKTLSKPRLQKANTINTTTGEKVISEERITETAWINLFENEHVKLLHRRVEHMTGLSINTAELLQIAYYVIGGLYFVHKDYFDDVQFFHTNTGNRIATVLFYMNDVPKGGATVFPDLNIALWPKKGSAAFWHNLKRNGEGDPLTAHGACPVLSGTKWIATQWLHEKGQELRRPCTLLENE